MTGNMEPSFSARAVFRKLSRRDRTMWLVVVQVEVPNSSSVGGTPVCRYARDRVLHGRLSKASYSDLGDPITLTRPPSGSLL